MNAELLSSVTISKTTVSLKEVNRLVKGNWVLLEAYECGLGILFVLGYVPAE